MTVSTRTRFEVFKRDGFTCVYCGATPTVSPLHVDHVEPVSAGGSDEPANLVTSCQRCNLGKSDVPLEQRRFAVAQVDNAQRDHLAQIAAYLEFQKEKAAVEKQIAEHLVDAWADLDGDYYPAQFETRVLAVVREFGIEDTRRAIELANAGKYARLRTSQKLKIFYGILRRWRETGERKDHVS